MSSAATAKGAEILDPVMVKFRSVWDGMTWRGLKQPAGVVALGRQLTPNMIAINTTTNAPAIAEDKWWQANASQASTTVGPNGVLGTTEEDASVNAVARAAVDAADSALRTQGIPFSEGSMSGGDMKPRPGLVHIAFKMRAPLDLTTLQEVRLLETEETAVKVIMDIDKWSTKANLGKVQLASQVELFVTAGPMAKNRWKFGHETWVDFFPNEKPPMPEDLDHPIVIFMDIENLEFKNLNPNMLDPRGNETDENRLHCISKSLAMTVASNFNQVASKIAVDYPSPDYAGKLQVDIMFNSNDRQSMVQMIDSKVGRAAWKYAAVQIMACPGVTEVQTGAISIDHVYVTFEVPDPLAGAGPFKRFVAYLKTCKLSKYCFLGILLYLLYNHFKGDGSAPAGAAAAAAPGAAGAAAAAAPAEADPKAEAAPASAAEPAPAAAEEGATSAS